MEEGSAGKSKRKSGIWPQIAFIMAWVTLFFLCALVSPYTDKSHVVGIGVEAVVISAVDVLVVIFLVKSRRTNVGRVAEISDDAVSPATRSAETDKDVAKGGLDVALLPPSKRQTISDWMRRHKFLLMVVAFVFLSRVWMLGTVQRWDAGEYFFALGGTVATFDFRPSTILHTFRLCTHSSMALTFFCIIPEFLKPFDEAFFQFYTLLFTCVSVWVLYFMFRSFLSKMSDSRAALAVLLCSCVPLFWGSMTYFTPDYWLAIFFLFFVFADYRDQYLLLFFWGFVLTQTKETGAVLLFGYFVARMLAELLGDGTVWERMQHIVRGPRYWCMFAGLFVFAVYYVGAAKLSQHGWSNASHQLGTNPVANAVGFDLGYIATKMQHFFITDFAWVMWAVILLAFVMAFVRHKRGCVSSSTIRWSSISGLIGAMVAYMLFGCFFITALLYRYNVVYVVLLAVFAVLALQALFPFDGRLPLGYVIGTLALSLICGFQTFLCIDLLSAHVFGTVSTGTTNMLNTHRSLEPLEDGQEHEFFGDNLVNNYQYAWIGRATDKMFSQVPYGSEIQFIENLDNYYYLQISGNGEQYTNNWNAKSRMCTMCSNPPIVELQPIEVGEIQQHKWYYNDFPLDPMLEKQAILVFAPFSDGHEEETLDALEPYYDIGERQTAKAPGGELYYYELRLK